MLGIKYLRTLQEMSLQEVASAIGVTKQTASKWENGKVIPKKRLQQLSELFNIEAEYLARELTEEDKLDIQSKKLSNELKSLDEFSKEEDIEEVFNQIEQGMDLIMKKGTMQVRKQTNDILDKIYHTNDGEMLELYMYFNQVLYDAKVDRKVIYSIIESIHETYNPNEEPLAGVEFCDMDLVSKLNNLLQEYKDKKD